MNDRAMLLPLSYADPYQQFKQQVVGLHQAIAAGEIAQPLVDSISVKAAAANLQHYFQTQILTLNLNELEPTIEHHVQSFNVEIDKQLRLLTMDCLFLQAAKQLATRQERRQHASDRLLLLTRYCNALLGEDPVGEALDAEQS